MGYCYEGRKLVCDMCSTAGARKRRCPADNYCPAPALCASCNAAVRKDGRWKDAHAGCYAASAAYKAKQAERARRLEDGEYLRTSASTLWETHPDVVEVCFRNLTGAEVKLYMTRETYRAIGLGEAASTLDFAAHGATSTTPEGVKV